MCDGLVSNTLSLSLPHQPITQWSATLQCVSKPLCCCHFNQCVVSAVLSHVCPFVQIPFSLTIRFGDDVITEHPPHSCLVIHNTVCHEQCVFQKCLFCLKSESIHRKSTWLFKYCPQWFHKYPFNFSNVRLSCLHLVVK